MIRLCLPSVVPAKAVRDENGRWSAGGFATDRTSDRIEETTRLVRPLNATFEITTSVSECLDGLTKNLSDASMALLSIHSISPHFYVPYPFLVGKLQFISGYNISGNGENMEDIATVSSNADLFKPSVYIGALSLLMCVILFIVLRTSMLFYLGIRSSHLSLTQQIKKQLRLMFYYNSVRFRWITLLYCLLIFIMITGFRCLYKTSRIIVEEPFYPKNYQQSLDYPSSLAFYVDRLTVVSSTFKNAPPDSIRGKLWAKLVATGRQNEFSTDGLKLSTLPAFLHKVTHELLDRKSICLVSPVIMFLIKSLACGLSPEHELWIVKVIADPIEHEIIYGRPIRTLYRVPRTVVRRMKALFEGHHLTHSYKMSLNQRQLAATIAGTSKSHQWRQNVVCDDDKAFAPEPHVSAISLAYFTPLFKVMAYIFIIAFAINLFEIGAIK